MDFSSFIVQITSGILKPITILIMGLAVVYFLYGVLKYLQSSDNEEKRKDGITMMTYGIIGLFVMVSLWGLVNILQGTFFSSNSNLLSPIKPPSLNGQQ